MLEEPLLVFYLVREAALVSTRTVYLAEAKRNYANCQWPRMFQASFIEMEAGVLDIGTFARLS